MGEIAALKEKIAARKYRSMELAGEIDRKIRDIKEALSGYPLDKIKNLRLSLVSQLAQETASLQEEYLAILSEITEAEKELV